MTPRDSRFDIFHESVIAVIGEHGLAATVALRRFVFDKNAPRRELVLDR